MLNNMTIHTCASHDVDDKCNEADDNGRPMDSFHHRKDWFMVASNGSGIVRGCFIIPSLESVLEFLR